MNRVETNIVKCDEGYQLELQGQPVAKISTERNPYHLQNCYLKFDQAELTSWENASQAQHEQNEQHAQHEGEELFDLFRYIATAENSPLQVMLSSREKEKAEFLAAHGFKKLRMCYEVSVKQSDLKPEVICRSERTGGTGRTRETGRNERTEGECVSIKRAIAGEAAYAACGELLYEYYRATHAPISPLTVSLEQFLEDLPIEVFYSGTDGQVSQAAFVEENEIAYVCSRDMDKFTSFAQNLVDKLFKSYQSIFFEADDVDPAGMALKGLFAVAEQETFDTWVYRVAQKA